MTDFIDKPAYYKVATAATSTIAPIPVLGNGVMQQSFDCKSSKSWNPIPEQGLFQLQLAYWKRAKVEIIGRPDKLLPSIGLVQL